MVFYSYLTLLGHITCGLYQSEGKCLKAVYFFVTPAPRVEYMLYGVAKQERLFTSLLAEHRVHPRYDNGKKQRFFRRIFKHISYLVWKCKVLYCTILQRDVSYFSMDFLLLLSNGLGLHLESCSLRKRRGLFSFQ